MDSIYVSEGGDGKIISLNSEKDTHESWSVETDHIPTSVFSEDSLQQASEKQTKRQELPQEKKVRKSKKKEEDGVKRKKEKVKGPRNDQNHPRTLTRFVEKISLGTYKIQLSDADCRDKRVLLAAIQILHEDSNLDRMKDFMDK